jgi:LmbE family N-acetylglucosaminyl deacetylase
MNILYVVAHPDDETVFAGGTLALLAARGAEVGLVCCTRGEGGEAGEPPLCSRAELGAVREAELRCAARALGCASVEFLPFRDPDVGPDGSLYPFADSPQDVIPWIQNILESHRPDAVITHGSGGEYGHPAHLLAHRAPGPTHPGRAACRPRGYRGFLARTPSAPISPATRASAPPIGTTRRISS